MAFKVTFRRSGITVDWEDRRYENLLEFAEDNGIVIPSGCRSGLDNVCETTLLSGEVDHGEAIVEIREGACLPCIARPMGDIVIDA